MRNTIIKELKDTYQGYLNKKGFESAAKIYGYILDHAKPIRCVKAEEVFDEYELEYIKNVIKPQQGECYENAKELTRAFPDKVRYCEGMSAVPVLIDHAFNEIDGEYVDITFEFALGENPKDYSYVLFKSYDAQEVEDKGMELDEDSFFRREYITYSQKNNNKYK